MYTTYGIDKQIHDTIKSSLMINLCAYLEYMILLFKKSDHSDRFTVTKKGFYFEVLSGMMLLDDVKMYLVQSRLTY